MSAKLKLISTLVLILAVTSLGISQNGNNTTRKSAKKVKIKKERKAAKYYSNTDSSTQEEEFQSYNTDLYDAISPGFSTEIPAVKTPVISLDESKRKKSDKK